MQTPTDNQLNITWQAPPYPPAGDIFWDEIETAFGPAIALCSPLGLCALGFSAQIGSPACLRDLAARWPHQRLTRSAKAKPLAHRAIAGDGKLHVRGTPFQLLIWQQLLLLEPAQTIAYSELAALAGRPRAVRAAATAVGQNPLSLIIPCHRVISKSGALGSYHWGALIKRKMLDVEQT